MSPSKEGTWNREALKERQGKGDREYLLWYISKFWLKAGISAHSESRIYYRNWEVGGWNSDVGRYGDKLKLLYTLS